MLLLAVFSRHPCGMETKSIRLLQSDPMATPSGTRTKSRTACPNLVSKQNFPELWQIGLESNAEPVIKRVGHNDLSIRRCHGHAACACVHPLVAIACTAQVGSRPCTWASQHHIPTVSIALQPGVNSNYCVFDCQLKPLSREPPSSLLSGPYTLSMLLSITERMHSDHAGTART